jgi:hypothetical protein
MSAEEPWPSAIDRAQFQADFDRGIQAAYVDFLAAFGLRYGGGPTSATTR